MAIKRMISKDDVTVMITNYNYGVYLTSCINSVLRGEIVPGRIIVVDDASVDNSLEILEQYKDRIEIMANPENLGITNSYNRAIQQIRSKWMFILDADNIISENYVSEFVRASSEFDDSVVIAYTDMFLFGKNAFEMATKVNASKYFETVIKAEAFFWEFPEYNRVLKQKLGSENFIHGNSFFRLDRFREIGGFSFDTPEDHNLWKRMISEESIFNATKLKNARLGYRQHSQTQTQKIVELKAIVSELYLRLFELEDQLDKCRENKKNSIGTNQLRAVAKRIPLKYRTHIKTRMSDPRISKSERQLWRIIEILLK